MGNRRSPLSRRKRWPEYRRWIPRGQSHGNKAGPALLLQTRKHRLREHILSYAQSCEPWWVKFCTWMKGKRKEVEAWEYPGANPISTFGRQADPHDGCVDHTMPPQLSLASSSPPFILLEQALRGNHPQRRLMEDVVLYGGSRSSWPGELDLASGQPLPMTTCWAENSRCVSVKTANTVTLTKFTSSGRRRYPAVSVLPLPALLSQC